jgi:hypothetical protein
MKTAKTFVLFSLAILALTYSATLVGIRLNLPDAAFANTETEYRTVFVSSPIASADEESNWQDIDEKELMANLKRELNKLTFDGFEVIEVTPITRGWMDTTRVRHGISGGGYGITQGLMIIAKKTSK